MKIWSLIVAAGSIAVGCALQTDATGESSAELDHLAELADRTEADDGVEALDEADTGRSGAAISVAPELRKPRIDARAARPRSQCSMRCAAGHQSCRLICRPGYRQPERCGASACGAGEYCCNESCGICSVVGGSCTQQSCGPG
jgi:hypothetical protein